ncbi:MAG: ABC transporter substrate-binding protein [Acidimicrobiales bacterium]
MGIDRRSFLIGAGGGAVLGGAALLGGCTTSSKLTGNGKGNSERTYTTPPDAGVGKGTPVKGGQLTIGTGSEVNGFDPASDDWDTTGITYANCVYDALAALAPDGSVYGYLAESITPNPDYDVWTIQLRPNIVFHNGTALDASAVKANLEAFVASELTGAAFNNVNTISVTSPLTVSVTTKTPWVAFPYYLTSQVGFMAEPSTLASTATNNPIGTGPFVFQSWEPNTHFICTKNPNYWRKGIPYLDTLQFTPIVDPGAREDAIRSGSVNLMQTNFTQNLVDLWDQPGFTLVNDLGSKFEPTMDCIMLNCAVAPTNDIRVRQALAYAANPEVIVQEVWNGIPPVATGPFLTNSPYYAPTGFPKFNLKKAQQLVKEVEADTGPISFNFDTLPSNQYVRINELVQSMWLKAGIQCTIQEIQEATLIQNAITGRYQATAWQQFNTPDPDGNYVWWSSKSVQPIGGLSLNMARNSDPALQAALQTGRASTDPQTRIEAYQTVGRRLAADLPYLWSNPAVWTIAAQSHVQNFNGGTFPNGSRKLGMISGVIAPGEIWLS